MNVHAPLILGVVLDCPALHDEHVDVPGFYFAATQEDATKGWRGYALFESNSQDTGYEKRSEHPLRATIGQVTAKALGSTVSYNLLDEASVVEIEMMHPNDELASVTVDEMLAGKNRFFCTSGEIFGAANCQLISTDAYTGLRKYRLTSLLRGIKGTFLKMDSWSKRQLVVRLDGAGVYFHPYSYSRIGEEVYFKFVAGGGATVQAFPFKVALPKLTVVPPPVVEVSVTRDGSNNATVTWQRQYKRSLVNLTARDHKEDEEELYRLRVVQSDVAVREVLVTARTWTYTGTMQGNDGTTPGDPFELEITPLSTRYLDGVPAQLTL